jgi:hypothetical protein
MVNKVRLLWAPPRCASIIIHMWCYKKSKLVSISQIWLFCKVYCCQNRWFCHIIMDTVWPLSVRRSTYAIVASSLRMNMSEFKLFYLKKFESCMFPALPLLLQPAGSSLRYQFTLWTCMSVVFPHYSWSKPHHPQNENNSWSGDN